MSAEVVRVDGWERAGRFAGYAAAVALAPYLLIKVSWVVGALLDVLPTGKGLGRVEWVVLNTVTIGMAAVGVVVALALVCPWGERLPARVVALPAWLGAGLLVPVLPSAAAELATGPGADSEMPAWEGLLIQAGFVGMGAGIAVALPAYVRRRWPEVLTGHLGDRRTCREPAAYLPLALLSVLVAGWAVGSFEDVAVVLLLEAWAMAGVVAAWCLVLGRPVGTPRAPALALVWLGSGSLLAWSAWKLPVSFLVDTAGAPPVHAVGVVAGALLLPAVRRGGG